MAASRQAPGHSPSTGHVDAGPSDARPADAAPGPSRPTLRLVAEAAGVSVSTASLVFSDKGPVAAQTRLKVLAEAKRLGYAGPDPLASSLRRGRSGMVAVVVEGRLLHAFRDPYAVSVLDGLAGVLDTIPSAMALVALDLSEPDAARARLASTALDAVVFLGCGPEGNPLVNALRARHLPMVALGAPSGPGITRVDVDNATGMRTLTDHLLALGHTRAATVTLPAALPSDRIHPARDVLAALTFPESRSRLEGVAAAFGEHTPAAVASTADVEGGLAAGRLLLGRGPASQRPTVVIAQSDLLAVGVMRAAQERGLRVPQDLSVTGFDGIDTPWLSSRLTTVAQPSVERGAAAGRLVAALVEGQRPRHICMEAVLRIGDTSARPADPQNPAALYDQQRD